MYSVQWISDNGAYLLFSENGPLVLSAPLRSGVGGISQTYKAPGQDGASTYGATLDQRTVSFSFALIAKGNKSLKTKTVLDEWCNILNEAFNPKTQGWIIDTSYGRKSIIRARPIATPTPRESGPTSIKFDVELLTDSATWQGEELISVKLGDLQESWAFPFSFPVTFGSYTQYTTIKNPSPEKICPVIEVYSQLETLKITNETTGEIMEVTHEIGENQYMQIDTDEGTVSLYENGVFLKDVSNWMDGDFISLIQGDNTIRVENNTPSDVPAAVLFYREIIMGV